MSQLTIDDLASRVERMERLIPVGRRWIAAAFAAIAIVFLLMLQPRLTSERSKNVVASNYLLENSNGDGIALLGVGSDGTPSLALFDAQKKARVLIGLRMNGSPYLSLADPQKVVRITLSLNNQNTPTLTMTDQQRQTRAVLGLTSDGDGVLNLYSGAGGLILSGSNGAVRWNPAAGAAQDMPVPK